jgi:hypothetical protein
MVGPRRRRVTRYNQSVSADPLQLIAVSLAAVVAINVLAVGVALAYVIVTSAIDARGRRPRG